MATQQNHLSRVWFLNQGCKQVPLEYTRGIVRWAHPDGYFLNAKGQKVSHNFCASLLKFVKDPNSKTGKQYPFLREANSKKCHILMALAFYGDRPTYIGKNGKEYVGICHHLIPDALDYKPANLLCGLTREQHYEADRRQRALKKVVPDGDLHLFSYERLRELQDPRVLTREQFETELTTIAQKGFHRADVEDQINYELTHHMEY